MRLSGLSKNKYTSRFLIIFIGLLFIASCNRQRYPQALREADTLLYYHHNDSAAALLKAFGKDTAKADKSVKMYYTLLSTALKDKQFILLKDLSVPPKLIDYYESHGSQEKLARAYFYMGCTYRDLNDALNAIKYYQKAEEVALKINYYRLLEAINRERGDLLGRQFRYKEAARNFIRYHKYVILSRDSFCLPTAQVLLGQAYGLLQDRGRSLWHLRKAVDLAEKSGDKHQIENATYVLARQLLIFNCYHEARPFLAYYNDAQLARYYNGIGRPDSVILYGKRQLAADSNDLLSRMLAYDLLSGVYADRKDYVKAYENLHQAALLNDIIDSVSVTNEIVRMKSLYNYQLVNKEKQRLEIKHHRDSLVIAIGISSFVVIVLLLVIFYQYQLNRKKQEKFAYIAQIREADFQLNQLKLNIRHHEEEIKTLQQEKDVQENEIVIHKQALQQLETEKNRLYGWLFRQSPVYRKIQKLEQQKDEEEKHRAVMKTVDQQELQKVLFGIYKEYIEQMKSLYPKLTDEDLRYLCLQQAGIDNLTIALCFGYTNTHTINQRKYRLKERMKGDM